MRYATLNLDRLRFCACGAAFLPHRKTHRFCSRRCAAAARPRHLCLQRPRPRATCPIPHHHRLTLRLLDVQPLERRARGGWRFGTRRISDNVVASLIASGRAEIRGERLHKRREET